MSTSLKMSDDKNQPSPVLAPPVVILICIAGAVAVVIAAAAMYRLCRRANAGAVDDVEGSNWNPNKRNKEQDKYMEEVRWRNNAFAWERAKQEKRDRNVYRRGWFKEQLERQRAREQGGWTAVSVNSTDEDGDMQAYDASSLSHMDNGGRADKSCDRVGRSQPKSS